MALTRTVALKLEPAQHAQLERAADVRGIPLSTHLRMLLEPHVPVDVDQAADVDQPRRATPAREWNKDDLATPKIIRDRLAILGPLDLDPCSNEWTQVRARVSYSIDRGEDGLLLPWFGYVYENPPYGRGWLAKFAAKAKREAKHAEIVSLIPTKPDTDSFAIRMSYACARVDLSSRLSFEGGAHDTGWFASTLFYSGPRPYLFAHAFCDLGKTDVYRVRKLRGGKPRSRP